MMIDTHLQPTTRLTHFRAYLAGTGATGSLIAGTVIVFLSLAAFVAFRGFPFGNTSGGSFGSAYIGSKGVGPPEAAGRALAAASRNIARSPAPGAPAGAAGLQNGNHSSGAASPGTTTSPTSTPSSTVGTAPPTTTTSTPSPSGTSSGPITNAVSGVGSATNTDPSSGTSQVTQPLDNTLTTTLNNAGAAAGNPSLGDQVDQTVNNTTGGLLNLGGGSGGN